MTHRGWAAASLSAPVVSVALVAALASVACTPAQNGGRPPTISLRMQGTPKDATVTVDEEAVGPLDFVAAHGIALPIGVHHVTVSAAGYFPLDRELEAQPGSPPIHLDVTLIPVPD